MKAFFGKKVTLEPWAAMLIKYEAQVIREKFISKAFYLVVIWHYLADKILVVTSTKYLSK